MKKVFKPLSLFGARICGEKCVSKCRIYIRYDSGYDYFFKQAIITERGHTKNSEVQTHQPPQSPIRDESQIN